MRCSWRRQTGRKWEAHPSSEEVGDCASERPSGDPFRANSRLRQVRSLARRTAVKARPSDGSRLPEWGPKPMRLRAPCWREPAIEITAVGAAALGLSFNTARVESCSKGLVARGPDNPDGFALAWGNAPSVSSSGHWLDDLVRSVRTRREAVEADARPAG